MLVQTSLFGSAFKTNLLAVSSFSCVIVFCDNMAFPHALSEQKMCWFIVISNVFLSTKLN